MSGEVRMLEFANNKTCLKFSAVLYPPQTLVTNDLRIPVKGWMVEVMDILAKKLGVCYQVVRSATYGVLLPNGSYTGLMGLLNRNEVDLSMTPLVMNNFRMKAFDFTDYIFVEEQQFIGRRPKAEADLAGVINVFPAIIWLYLLVITLITLAGIFTVDFVFASVTDSRKNPAMKRMYKTHSLKNEVKDYSLWSCVQKSMVWTIASLLSQALPWNPKGISVRIMTGVWLIFCLIIGTLYRSNLKAMMILPKISLPFHDIEEVVKGKFPVLIAQGSFVNTMVLTAPENSTTGKLVKQANFEPDAVKAAFKMSSGESVGLTSLTALMHFMHLDFSYSGECHLFVTQKTAMYSAPVGVPIPRGSPLKPKINKILSSLREFGILGHLYKKEVVNSSECAKPISAILSIETLRPLEMKDFFGVFSILAGGLVLGFFAFIGEILAGKFIRSSAY